MRRNVLLQRFFDLAGAISAFTAALYWFRSAGPSIDESQDVNAIGSGVAKAGGILRLMVRSSKLNRHAAFWAGVSALCAVGHSVVDFFSR